MNLENELIEHQIKIDEFMTVVWKIPKLISVIEMKALTYKTNKLFNLSEIQIADEPSQKKKVWSHHWTDELTELMLSLKKDGLKPKDICVALVNKTGDNYFAHPKVIYQKLNYLQQAHKNVQKEIPKVPQETKGKLTKYSDEMNTMIINLHKENKSASIIATRLNEVFKTSLTTKQILDKIGYMKKRGEL